MFPDDQGTSIVTRRTRPIRRRGGEPVIRATVSTARGVATRAPAPAPWVHRAWAAAGAVLGWLGAAIRGRGGAPAPPARDAERRTARAKAREDEDEDEAKDEAKDEDEAK